MGFSDQDRILMKKCVRFQRLWSKKLIKKDFLNKGWRLCGLNKLSQETDTTAKNDNIESIQNISWFHCVIFIHKLDIIRKE